MARARTRGVVARPSPADSQETSPEDDNSGLGGSFRLVRLKDGTSVGHVEVQEISRVISDPKHVQVLDMRYGIIRAQALTPRESMALIEKVLGET